jgi:hypothetical protein
MVERDASGHDPFEREHGGDALVLVNRAALLKTGDQGLNKLTVPSQERNGGIRDV